MTTLSPETLDWSLRFLLNSGDNSLFRPPFEFEIIEENWDSLKKIYSDIDIERHRWNRARRFLFPKDRESFRRASQLDPADSLLLTALVREIGPLIESKRLPPGDGVVFSFRFDPAQDGELYRPDDGWSLFWRRSKELANTATSVVRTDIAEFYNQVNHEVIQEQLEECEAPEAHRKALRNFLAAFSSEAKRGLPIGPHAVHLLAELSMVSFDNLLSARGYRFTRYIDDIHVFCKDTDPQLALFDIADILDRDHGLSLNRGKTRLLTKDEFLEKAEAALQEASLSVKERGVLEVINELTDSPYHVVAFEKASNLNAEAFSQEVIEAILGDCLKSSRVDYPHLAWLLRRLAQVKAPGGVEYIINHLDEFIPVIGDAATYLATAGETYDGKWPEIGARLLDSLELPIVKRSDYLQSVLQGLFARIDGLNQLDRLTGRFWAARPAVRREIVLAAAAKKTWVYELRHSLGDFDPWLRRAFAFAARKLARTRQRKCLEALLATCGPDERAILETILRPPKQTKHRTRTGGGHRQGGSGRSVFLSYNHRDREVARRLRSTLLSKGVNVVIDDDANAGEKIDSFIQRAISTTDWTVLVVSRASLLSSWVGLEVVLSAARERLESSRRLIGCYLDDAFLKDGFVLEAVEEIDGEIKRLEELATQYSRKKIDTADLNSKRTRLFELRNNLPMLVLRLNDSLVLDIREKAFQNSVRQLVDAIKE